MMVGVDIITFHSTKAKSEMEENFTIIVWQNI